MKHSKKSSKPSSQTILSILFFLMSLSGMTPLTMGTAVAQEATTKPEALPETPPTDVGVAEEEPPAKESGPETIAFPSSEIGVHGNWRKKKDWLKQALDKNELIQDILGDVQNFKKTFYSQSFKISGELSDFYQQAGFDEGEISSLFDELSEEIEKAKGKTKELFSHGLSDIDEDEKKEAQQIKQQFTDIYGIEEKFKKEKERLEQLKVNMKSIKDLSKSINERLEQVKKQVDLIEDEAQKADEQGDKVWHVIDDLKARDLFYSLSGSYERVKNIQDYLENDLIKNFGATIKTTRDQIKKTTIAIEKLEDDGIIVRNRAARLEQENKKRLRELKMRELEDKKGKRKPKKRARRVKKESLLTRIWNQFVAFLSWLYGVFN